jgi:NACHT domain
VLVQNGAGRAFRATVAAAGASHGLQWGQIVSQLAIWVGIAGGVAAVIAIVPQTRQGMQRLWRALLMRAGIPYHRYAVKFIERFGSYDNPYLRVKEKRDLLTTYVPLSFQSGDTQNVVVATEILTNLPAERLVIVGDPGTGKSTLLRAYGVGVLESSRIPGRRFRVVPYLIPLRDLAAFLTEDKGVAEYITDKILTQYGVFRRDRVAEFFTRTLQLRQAVVMLDGLDEVPDEKLQSVLTAVIAFIGDMNQERPTGQAKILLTCRTQNFEMLREKQNPGTLREDWMAAFAGQGEQGSIYALAPLRDSEISSYLLKFKSLFKTVDGPARFMRSVRESKTLDLLRAPLILAIAVGLYADRPTMIPSTVSELYHHMIEELLDRHAFRHERRPDESLLAFRRSDKYSLLRQFALSAAETSGNFNDFTRGDLNQFAIALAPSLEAVDNPLAMVAEVINHSGLLTSLGHGNLWHFSHRSIQEFLTAEEFRLRGDGDEFLLGKADDLNWWQAIQFYTSGQEARQVDAFVRDLAKRNSELAAHCLQAAKPSDEAAREVLTALKPITDARVGALAAASRSPRTSIQSMAVEDLKRFLTESEGTVFATGTGAEEMLPLLESIASTNAAEIATFIPQIIKTLPDDPRLVGPLWQCLSASGVERSKAECIAIVRRLLTLVMDPNSFAELDRQDPHDRDFLTNVRARAYPFKNALQADHNMVTLLAWAEYLEVAPAEPNRYFQAKTAKRLDRIEADKRQTLSFSLSGPARILSSLLLLTAFVAAVVAVVLEPREELFHPLGPWMLLLYFAIGESSFWLYVIIFSMVCDFIEQLTPLMSMRNIDDEMSGNIVIKNNNVFFGIGLFIIAPFAFTISAVPLLSDSLLYYILLSVGSQIIFWMTDLKVCLKGSRRYLYRPNVFVDVYNDPKSRHWLVPGGGPGL